MNTTADIIAFVKSRTELNAVLDRNPTADYGRVAGGWLVVKVAA